MPPNSEGSSLSDKDNLFEYETVTFHIGGWESIYGQHYNVDKGDPLPTDLSEVDYMSIQVDPDIASDLWVHIDGPFGDYDDVYDRILYWQENGSP